MGGLLPDYLSPQASEQNYEHGMKPLVGDAGALVGKTLQYFIEDNVEIDRMYSWTPRLLEEFQKRRGYNPAPYLAAMAGEIVETSRSRIASWRTCGGRSPIVWRTDITDAGRNWPMPMA